MPAPLLALFLASAGPLPPQQSPPPLPPIRTEEAPNAATPFHPDLEAAIGELALEEVRWNRLAMRYGDGEQKSLEKLYGEALDAIPREVVNEFRDGRVLSTRTVYEMLASWKADEIFRRLLEQSARAGRPLVPEDLLAVLRSPELAKLPRDRVPRPILEYVDEVRSRTSADISIRVWYPSVAFLVFAALNARDGMGAKAVRLTQSAAASPTPRDPWWPDDAAGNARRAEFITTLLELVASAEDPSLMTSIVDVALAPPLDLPHKKGLVACCRSEFASHRGSVGFDRSHLEYVSRFGVDAQQPPERIDGVTLAPLMVAPSSVAGFMAMMRLRILLELDPRALEGPAALRFGTAAEVEAWYRAIFAERGWRNFWAEAGPDVEKMVAGTFPDLRDAKIDALAAQLADPSLSDEEHERLQTEMRDLEASRQRDQEHLAGVILQLLASAGDPELVKDELLRLHPNTPYGDWYATMLHPWLTLLGRDTNWVDGLIDEQTSGRREVPAPALECALLDLRRRLRREVRSEDVALLVELGTKGPTSVRGSAFFDQALLPSAAARRLYDAALADAAAPPGSPRDDTGRRLLRPMMELLFERRAEPWVHAALLDSFEHGRGSGGSGDSIWRGEYVNDPPADGPLAEQIARRNRELLEWLARELSDDEFLRLALEGRIPEKIGEERARIRRGVTPSGR
jgi:hypothetical protein